MRQQVPAPEGWAWSKVKYTADFFTGWTPPTGEPELFSGDNLWANISDLGPKHLSDTAKRISDEAVRRFAIRVSVVGSVLFGFKLSIGQVSFADREMYTNEAIATFPPQPNFNTRWAYWALPIFVPQNAKENIYGAKLLNRELIRSADILVPPPSEQERIANFLDEQTARIDALIAEKERLDELLGEYRSSLISAAVTGQPIASLMPSSRATGKEAGCGGGEGGVGVTWPTTRLRYVADLNPAVRADLLGAPDTEVSFLPMEAIGEDGSLKLDRVRPVSEVRNGYSYFEDGDVAFAKVTPCFENGKGALMRNLVLGAGFGTSELTVLRPKGDTSSRFLNYVVQSQQFRQHGAGAMTGAGGLKRVPDEFTRDFKTPWPPRTEQERIADFLDEQTARIDALREHVRAHIERLREYRSSLISAAVTGQLDLSTFKAAA